MPNWLLILLSRIATSGIFALLSSKRGMLFGGFGLLVLGSLFGSIPFVLIGAFVMLWAATRVTEPTE
jgi:hypothetical protein